MEANKNSKINRKTKKNTELLNTFYDTCNMKQKIKDMIICRLEVKIPVMPFDEVNLPL